MLLVGGLDRMATSMTLLKGSTLPDGEVDPMDISMILSSGAFNLQDGALVQMDISMTLQKGSMHQGGGADLTVICMILQKDP